MADKKISESIIEIEKPFPKQIEFFNSDKRYTAYGGARGGGKSFAARGTR